MRRAEYANITLEQPAVAVISCSVSKVGGGGRNRAPLVADDRVIMPYFIGDSSRLCHYWNIRSPLGLLAILLAIADRFSSSGHNIGGKIGAILGARVCGMTSGRIKLAAWMLPNAAPLVPMKAKHPKHFGQCGLASG